MTRPGRVAVMICDSRSVKAPRSPWVRRRQILTGAAALIGERGRGCTAGNPLGRNLLLRP